MTVVKFWSIHSGSNQMYSLAYVNHAHLPSDHHRIFYHSDMNKPLSGLLVCRLTMSLAEGLPSKFHICHRSFSAKYSFFGQSLSCGHYQPTYQPPEGVYLLIIRALVRETAFSLACSRLSVDGDDQNAREPGTGYFLPGVPDSMLQTLQHPGQC